MQRTLLTEATERLLRTKRFNDAVALVFAEHEDLPFIEKQDVLAEAMRLAFVPPKKQWYGTAPGRATQKLIELARQNGTIPTRKQVSDALSAEKDYEAADISVMREIFPDALVAH